LKKPTINIWSHFTEKCLFLAKGPSLNFLENYLDYGHIATVNESCLTVPTTIDYAFFNDLNALLNSKPAWNRIRSFVLPVMVFDDNVDSPPIPIDSIEDFPIERAITFNQNQHTWDHQCIQETITSKGFVNTDTSVMGLHFLIMKGYKNLFLLGHDGGIGYGEKMPCIHENRDMQKFRDILEFVSNELCKYYKNINIKFFDGKEIKSKLSN
jgi:hypothetical protein